MTLQKSPYVLLASGVFGWDADERRSNRYGSIHLSAEPYNGRKVAKQHYECASLDKLAGRRVRVTCTITETRTSGHAGDAFLRILPSTPNVHDVIDLGICILQTKIGWDGQPDILLTPEDGREHYWIDPRKLYRLHDQTVSVYAEETSEPNTEEPFAIATSDQPAAIDNGDGSFQVKNVSANEKMRVFPHVKHLGGGLFSMTHSPGAGARMHVEKVK